MIIEDKLDSYLKKKKLLIHNFWNNILHSKSDGKEAVEFCYDLGRHSEKLKVFFKCYVYLLSLRIVNMVENLNSEMRMWDKDFEYFMKSLQKKYGVKNSED